MKTWQKFIALILVCLQLFGCADQAQRSQQDLYAATLVSQLKAAGSNAAWVDGSLVVASNDRRFPMKIRFLHSDPAGFVFLVALTNRSKQKLALSRNDFFCRQKNFSSPEDKWPALSIEQVMASYDQQIAALQDSNPNALVAIAQVAAVVIVILLFLVVLSKSGGSFGSWSSSSAGKTESPKPSNSDAIQQLRILKHQQRELMLSVETLQPGGALSSLIVCPFNSLGDSGLYITYRDFLFEFNDEVP